MTMEKLITRASSSARLRCSSNYDLTAKDKRVGATNSHRRLGTNVSAHAPCYEVEQRKVSHLFTRQAQASQRSMEVASHLPGDLIRRA
jgi:hypothetical protein